VYSFAIGLGLRILLGPGRFLGGRHRPLRGYRGCAENNAGGGRERERERGRRREAARNVNA
jgi:hypothetical protein